MALCNNDCTALTEATLALVDLATLNRLPLPGPLAVCPKYNRDQTPSTAAMLLFTQGRLIMRLRRVILMSLRQENVRSFLDHLPNGSSHFEIVGWI